MKEKHVRKPSNTPPSTGSLNSFLLWKKKRASYKLDTSIPESTNHNGLPALTLEDWFLLGASRKKRQPLTRFVPFNKCLTRWTVAAWVLPTRSDQSQQIARVDTERLVPFHQSSRKKGTDDYANRFDCLIVSADANRPSMLADR